MVYVNGVYSTAKEINNDVPQGSILASSLFCCYFRPLEEFLEEFCINFRLYGADTILLFKMDSSCM